MIKFCKNNNKNKSLRIYKKQKESKEKIMLQITPGNINSTGSNKISFKQNITKEMVEAGKNLQTDSLLNVNAARLFRKINQLIDDTWVKFKEEKVFGKIPEFVKRVKNDKMVTLKPLYNTEKKSVLFEIRNGRFSDRFIIDRTAPNDFKYEHTIKTDYGSATTKTYDSKRSINPDIIQMLNENIEEYFPKLLPSKNKLNPYIK